MVTEVNARTEYVEGLRMLAAILETNMDLPLPEGEVTWPIYEDAKATLTALAKAIPGKVGKDYASDDYFRMHFALRGLRIRAWAYRDQVCTRVVKGSHVVTRMAPAPGAALIEVEDVVEDVEWICEPILAASVSS